MKVPSGSVIINVCSHSQGCLVFLVDHPRLSFPLWEPNIPCHDARRLSQQTRSFVQQTRVSTQIHCNYLEAIASWRSHEAVYALSPLQEPIKFNVITDVFRKWRAYCWQGSIVTPNQDLTLLPDFPGSPLSPLLPASPCEFTHRVTWDNLSWTIPYILSCTTSLGGLRVASLHLKYAFIYKDTGINRNILLTALKSERHSQYFPLVLGGQQLQSSPGNPVDYHHHQSHTSSLNKQTNTLVKFYLLLALPFLYPQSLHSDQ